MVKELKIKIGELELPLPEKITLRDFANLTGYNIEGYEHDQLICATLLRAPLSIFTGTSKSDLAWLKLALVKPLIQLEGESPTEINGYKLIDFDKISIGTFADLDVLYTEDLQGNVEWVASILWDAPIEEVSEWDITKVFPSLIMYKNWRLDLYRKYKNLFSSEGGNGEESGESTSPRHTWYTLLMTLCADRFVDLDYVQSRPATEALNYLAYMKAKNAKLAAEMKKGLKKLKKK